MQAVPILVELTGAKSDERIEALRAVLYDRTGKMAGHTVLKVVAEGTSLYARGEVQVDPKAVGDTARLLIAPVLETGKRRPFPVVPSSSSS
jgi:hypothetical protein